MAKANNNKLKEKLRRIKPGRRSGIAAIATVLATVVAIGGYLQQTHFFLKKELGVDLAKVIKDIPLLLSPGKPLEVTAAQRKALGEIKTKAEGKLRAGDWLDAEQLLRLGNVEYSLRNTTKAQDYYTKCSMAEIRSRIHGSFHGLMRPVGSDWRRRCEARFLRESS